MSLRLILELTPSSVRVATASGSTTRMKLEAVFSQPLALGQSPAEGLRTLLKTAKLPSGPLISILPREQALTRVIKFPATRLDELTPMVELYAKAQLPYPREQAVMDFSIIRQGQGFSTVMLVACQREVIDRHLAVLNEAELSPALITMSSWGILEWFRRLGRAQVNRGPTLIINMDSARTDLVIANAGQMLSSRSLDQGASSWMQAPETAELLVTEVERSRTALRKELPGHELRAIIMTGVAPDLTWREVLSQRFAVPVDVVDPVHAWKGITVSLTPPGSPVVLGGIAGSNLQELINLSPPELRGALQHRRQVRQLVSVSVLAFSELALGAGILGLHDVRQQQVLGQLDRQIQNMKPTAKHVQEKRRSLHMVGSLLSDRRQLAASLSDVFQKTPPNMTLEHVDYEHGRRELTLRGSAMSNQAVLEYLKILEHVDGVRASELKYVTARITSEGERTSFEIILHLEASA